MIDLIPLLASAESGGSGEVSAAMLGLIDARDYGTSGSAQTTTGTIDAGTKSLSVTSASGFTAGQGIRIAAGVQAGTKEVVTLQITAGVTTAGTITVWLNGLNYPVAVTAGQTAIQVADAIRAAASDKLKFRQYVTAGTSGTDTAVFTAKSPTTKPTAPTFAASTTGVTATINVTTIGVPQKDHVAKISAVSGTRFTLDVACPLAVTNGTIYHDERVALQAAVDAAISEKKPLYVSAGTFNVYLIDTGAVFDPTNPQRTLTIDATAGPLTVYGAGNGITKIQVGPEAPWFTYTGFTISARYDYEFRDFSVVGPSDTNDGDLDVMPNTVAIYGQGYNLANEASGVTTFRNLFVSNFVQCVTVSSNDALNSTGVVTYTFRSCKLRAYSVTVAVFRDTSKVVCRKRFHAYDCDFSSGTPEGRGNILYIHPHVSMFLSNCILHDNWRAGVHHHSDSANYNYTPAAEYAVIRDCHFYNITNQTILCSNNVPVEISGCTFRNSAGILIRESAIISDCEFNGKKPDGTCYTFLSYYNNKLPPISDIIVTSTRVNGRIVPGRSGYTWKLADCTLQNANDVILDIEVDSGRVELANCRLTNTLANVGAESPTAIRYNGNNVMIARDCIFEGKFISGLLTGPGGALPVPTSEIVFDRNRLAVTSDTKFMQYGADTANQIRGSGNRWTTAVAGGQFWWASNAGHSLLCQDLAIGPGFSPTALASAATIIIGLPNYDIYHVTGVAAIDSVVIGKTGDDDTLLFAGSRLTLIADAGWSISGLGNIIPLSTAARVAGSTVRLLFDQPAGKWREF